MAIYEIEIKREVTVHGEFEIEATTPEEAFALMEKILEKQYDLIHTYNTVDTFKWKDHYVDDFISVSPNTHNENATN